MRPPLPCSRQNCLLRKLEATVPFELEQMGGACHHVERLTVQSLLFVKTYDSMHIETNWLPCTLSLGHPRVHLSDDFAALLGELVIQTTLEHVRRNLIFTHAVPRRQALLLSEDASVRGAFLNEFKTDMVLFAKLSDESFAGQDIMVSRSPFQQTSVRQLQYCLDADDWEPTARTVASKLVSQCIPVAPASAISPSVTVLFFPLTEVS